MKISEPTLFQFSFSPTDLPDVVDRPNVCRLKDICCQRYLPFTGLQIDTALVHFSEAWPSVDQSDCTYLHLASI